MSLRTIDFIEPVKLTDKEADFFTSVRNKSTLHYFCSSNNENLKELEVLLHQKKNDIPVKTYIFIENSHKHQHFFNLLQKYHIGSRKAVRENVIFYPNLSMTTINNALTCCHNEKGCDNLRKALTAVDSDYSKKLPKRFDAYTTHLPETSIEFIYPSILRCVVSVDNDATMISCRFRCISTNESKTNMFENMKPPFSKPQQSRTFEQTLFQDSIVWPYKYENKKNNYKEKEDNRIVNSLFQVYLNRFGFVVLPLCLDFLSISSQEWCTHIGQLITRRVNRSNIYTIQDIQKLSDDFELTYRFKNQKQSAHIPQVHGVTLYGHCLKYNLLIIEQVLPIIEVALFSIYNQMLYTIVGTADIIVLFPVKRNR